MWGFGVLIFDFFGFFSYQFNVVTVFRFCHRTFVSTYPSRSTPFSYHFVNFFLRPVWTQKCPDLCGILSPSTPSEFLHTSRDSPCPWQKSPCLCVSVSIYSYRFGTFFCVPLCSLTLIHPSAPTHTHPNPTVSLIAPPCLPYLTHVIRVFPHPYLCRVCPPAPTRASPCPLHVSDRAPTHHCIHPHPITPIYDPFLYVYLPIYHTPYNTLYFVRFDNVYNIHRFRVVSIRVSW